MSQSTHQGLPHSAGRDTPVNAAGTAAVATVSSRVEPIRFPHIPARTRQLPPVDAYSYTEHGGLTRRDEAHLVEPAAAPTTPISSFSRDLPTASNETDRAAARNREAHRVSTEQVSQIAEYLRRKRDELETENAELAISTWQQQQLLLLQRESLRQNLTAIRRLNSLTEKMRCELIELGHCLVDAFDGNDSLIQQFSQLCETYAEVAEQAKLVRAA
ncbi:MAG: hypothetical protein ABL888_03975 [Pirellulaceae bacterium]